MDRDFSTVASTTDNMLKQTMPTVGAMLSGLPRLRTIDVPWFRMTLRIRELTETAPPTTRL